MKVLALIPARFASSRFPGKPLVQLGGKTMIQRVCEQVSKAEEIDDFAVVTDDERIFRHVQSIGYQVFNSDPDHQSGTDRCAEIAKQMPEFDIVVNVQGDEPFIQPTQIDLLVSFLKSSDFQIATLCKRITPSTNVEHRLPKGTRRSHETASSLSGDEARNSSELFNPNVVKTVFDKNGKALYFSRSPIPHVRGFDESQWIQKGKFYKHIGLYAFRQMTLLEIAHLPQGLSRTGFGSELEKSESLEQLRWLENGYSIGITETTEETIGIDTPEDLAKAEAFLKLKM